MADLHYPNLSTCKVALSSSTIGTKPAVKLPQDCIDVLSTITIPQPYDFCLENSVMAKKEEREADQELNKASSRDELQKAVVVKMKAVTNADDDVCISILEDYHYDLKQSVEAFFQSS